MIDVFLTTVAQHEGLGNTSSSNLAHLGRGIDGVIVGRAARVVLSRTSREKYLAEKGIDEKSGEFVIAITPGLQKSFPDVAHCPMWR